MNWFNFFQKFKHFSSFTIARGFKVVTVSPSTHTAIRPQLFGAPQLYSYGIIEAGGDRERENERDKLLR